MSTRTTGAIALRPTGNAQGGFYFMSLTTGRRLSRNHWTMLPMPQDVIDRVHVLARRQNVLRGLEFLNRDNDPIVENDGDGAEPDGDDDDSSYGSQDAEDDLYSLPDIPIAGVYDEENDDDDNDDENIGEDVNLDGIENPEAVEDFELENPEDPDQIENPEDEEIENLEIANPEDQEVIENPEIPPENVEDVAAAMDERYGPRTGAYALRTRKERNYGHLHTVIDSFVMTQYSMKKGLQMFGNDGVDAVLAELKQLHDRKVMIPMNDLPRQKKRGALEYLMFLKKKRCGKIKARGCADGRKQRLYTAKEDASSPTVSIEALLLTCVIDAKEGRDVATADIPGAFMQADMDEEVFMRLEGKMVDLLLMLDREFYGPKVVYENGKKVLYVLLSKALYGTLRASLLFYRKLKSKLESWGFEINPYDWCVANKMIDGEQCTVVWHVDDLKISHKDTDVVTSILKQLNDEFGKEAPLSVTRGKVHDYLGMRIDYSEPGKVKITMIDYIEKMLDELPPDMDGEAVTPACNHLFEVNQDDPEALDSKTSEFYHHNTAMLLFLCKRARPDIQPAVAFLTTRVKAPDMDDYKKLARAMRYLRATKNMPLVLEADDMQLIKWWVDASFAVHPDMKGHTGGVMSLGKGAVYATSTRQKLVTRSSTEAELVGVYDVMPQILWTRHFLESQGYAVQDSIVHQDNKSAMLLENNGRGSSSKRTRHLNIRYFFVTDHIASKDLSVRYCPTSEMISDFFTKPLQGALFRKMRDLIMNVDPSMDHLWDHRSVLSTDSTGNDQVKR